MFDELIARLEQAAGPDRELECAIYATAVDYQAGRGYWNWRGTRPKEEPVSDEEYWRRAAPAYTTSLDASLTLWDEPGKHWTRGVNLFYAIMPGRKMQWASLAWESNGQYILDRGRGEHKHRAIATCIAALRARTAAQKVQAGQVTESVASPHV